MRIDKYICDTINITRTQARRLISAGKVLADNVRVVSSALQIDENTSIVQLDGKILKYTKYIYIMMNKPKGVLSATMDRHTKTALDLLAQKDRYSDLFIAGRLDKDSTGFLLITNDGQFAHCLLAPKKHVAKTYEVTLAHDNFEGYKQAFEIGIKLEDGYVCKPAIFEAVSECKCLLKISEGKFHQIKRMFKTLGNEVIELKRVSIGKVDLDPQLKEGEYRRLTDEEYELFLNEINKNNS